MIFNNTYEVQEWLEQVKTYDEHIMAKIAEREQLWTLATKTTGSIGFTPHGTEISDKVGNSVVRLAQLIDETNAAIDRYIEHKQQVITALEQLPEKEYSVLHRLYIRYMTMDDVAKDMNYSVMQIWRYKVNGLKILKDVMKCY